MAAPGFAACTAVIVFAGARLSRYGDIIAWKTGLGRGIAGSTGMSQTFVDPHHVVPALSAKAMTAIAVMGLTYRAEKKRLVLAWDSIGILAVYAVDFAVLRSVG